MGVIYHTRREPDLRRYEPEFNKDGSEKHICCDGARYHVLSYRLIREGYKGEDRVEVHCSEPNCEMNKR